MRPLRRLATRLVWLGLVCLSLLCGPGLARAERITFWVSETDPLFTKGTQYLLDAFMALNPDIEVALVPVDEGEVAPRLREAWREGREPNLVLAPSESLLALSLEGILDTTMAERMIAEIGPDRFFNGPLGLLEDVLEPSHFAVPYYAWLQGLWYRKDWFEEAGIAPPTNLFDLLDAARRLADPAKGRYGLALGTKGDGYTTQVFSQIAVAAGVTLVDRKAGMTVDTPEMVRALTLYRDLARTAPPGHLTPTVRDYYFQDRLTMMFYSTHIMDDLALSGEAAISLTGDNFPELSGASFNPELLPRTGLVPALYDSSLASFGLTMALAFPYPATQAQAAAVFRLTRFLYRDDVMVSWMHKAPGGMMPVLRGVARREAFLRDPQGVFGRWGRDIVIEVGEGLDAMRSLAQMDGIPSDEAARLLSSGVIGEMVRRVLDGENSPAEAAAWGQRAALRLSNGQEDALLLFR
jgi:multiple sugar transport system substrate-binding protein